MKSDQEITKKRIRDEIRNTDILLSENSLVNYIYDCIIVKESEICELIDKTNWAKVFEDTTYYIDGKSVWGHDTECYEDFKVMSEDFAKRIKDSLKSAIRGDKE